MILCNRFRVFLNCSAVLLISIFDITHHNNIKAVQGDSCHDQADMVTEVYGHIPDEDRKKNAKMLAQVFYKKENLNSDIS